MTAPYEPEACHVATALEVAARSPCRSKRGVVIFDPETDAFRGSGHNGPPGGSCPGRAVCAGKCGQLSVHAEVRALRAAAVYIAMMHPPGPYDLVHVERAADGTVVACDGPRCIGCAVQILDVGFIGGVWLYEAWSPDEVSDALTGSRHRTSAELVAHARRLAAAGRLGEWRRYTAEEFHRATLERCGMVAP